MTGSIDQKHLELYVGGDDALRDEILTIFEEQALSLKDRIDVAADDEEWRDVMHAMKGAARGVGAWAVGDLCEDAEAMVGDVDNKSASRKAAADAINARLEETIAAARRLRDRK
ncbi:MAG: Hpt domain-containing protein [Pseudomonadota bacterium]